MCSELVEKRVERYIFDLIRLDLIEEHGPNWIGVAGQLVLERGGKFGIVHDSCAKKYVCAVHPSVVYNGNDYVSNEHNTLHFVVLKKDMKLPPITW